MLSIVAREPSTPLLHYIILRKSIDDRLAARPIIYGLIDPCTTTHSCAPSWRGGWHCTGEEVKATIELE